MATIAGNTLTFYKHVRVLSRDTFYVCTINDKTQFVTCHRRRRRDCPICSKKNLAKLSNHLADIHQLSGEERQHYLSKARSLSDQRESEEMLNRKRMRSESDDEMSTASSSEERTSKETLSEKRMRNESDDETSTASDEDIFSSSGEEDAVNSEEDAESFEEINDSDESEEEDP